LGRCTVYVAVHSSREFLALRPPPGPRMSDPPIPPRGYEKAVSALSRPSDHAVGQFEFLVRLAHWTAVQKSLQWTGLRSKVGKSSQLSYTGQEPIEPLHVLRR
jgi:hypothetical protein